MSDYLRFYKSSGINGLIRQALTDSMMKMLKDFVDKPSDFIAFINLMRINITGSALLSAIIKVNRSTSFTPNDLDLFVNNPKTDMEIIIFILESMFKYKRATSSYDETYDTKFNVFTFTNDKNKKIQVIVTSDRKFLDDFDLECIKNSYQNKSFLINKNVANEFLFDQITAPTVYQVSLHNFQNIPNCLNAEQRITKQYDIIHERIAKYKSRGIAFDVPEALSSLDACLDKFARFSKNSDMIIIPSSHSHFDAKAGKFKYAKCPKMHTNLIMDLGDSKKCLQCQEPLIPAIFTNAILPSDK